MQDTIKDYDQEIEKMYNPENFISAPTERDIDPETGKITRWHLDRCNGCSLCAGETHL